jgi:hypothetical protein
VEGNCGVVDVDNGIKGDDGRDLPEIDDDRMVD